MDSIRTIKPSKGAIVFILAIILLGFLFGFASHYIFYGCSNTKESIEIEKQIQSKKNELSQLTKVVDNIKQVADTSRYTYEAQIMFSTTTVNTSLVETNKSEITATIQTSKEFYHQIRDSTVLEENTTVYGTDDAPKVNINKIILVKKSRYEID